MAQQARAKATRQHILDAAAVLFGERGYAVGISDIIRAAGVNKGSLYFHFESKEALAHEIIALQHELSMTVDDETLADAPPLIRLIAVTTRLSAQAHSSPLAKAGHRLSMDASAFEEPPREPFAHWIALFTQLLTTARAEGVVTGNAPAETYAFIAVTLFAGAQVVLTSLGDESGALESAVTSAWVALLPAILTDASHENAASTVSRAVELAAARIDRSV
jgi:AcrR family transcriptional regulator